jgi:3-oxoacyl-[acyl-carrier protein] reductase
MSDRETMLITGTSRGIGKAMAQYFSAKDIAVIGCSRSAATFANENYRHFSLDLTAEGEVKAFARTLKKEYGFISTLVANAGLTDTSVFTTLLSATSSELYEKFVKTNLTATFYICRDISKIMIRQQYGRIITISSLAATLHHPGTGIYAATKAAITEMTKIMARELAAGGITCNVIAPGLIDTELTATIGDEWRQRMLSEQTIQKPITVDALCHAISYFSSKECGYLTGQVLDIGAIR